MARTPSPLLRRLSLGASTAAVLTLAAWAPLPALAGPFDPVVIVNDRIVTQYEIDQRVRFLTLLRAAADPAKEAEKSLIEDRLRLDEAARLGVTASEEQILAGMDEFASRAQMTADQFVQALGGGGVERQAFRDFVTAGLVWREVIRAKYAGNVQISDAEVDKELARSPATMGGARVLLSELILPAPPGREAAAMDKARALAARLRGEAAFAAAARSQSASQSRARGGKLDWMPLENLPPALRQIVLGLAPGEVSAPYQVDGAVAIFLMRDLDEGASVGKQSQALDYATMVVPTGTEAAAAIRARANSCDDLYPVARKSGTAVTRQTQPQAQIGGGLALELARLDAGEAAITTSAAGQAMLVMLCARDAILPEAPATPAPGAPVPAAADGTPAAPVAAGPDRDAIRSEILNRRLTGFADRDLAKLRAEAVIVRP